MVIVSLFLLIYSASNSRINNLLILILRVFASNICLTKKSSQNRKLWSKKWKKKRLNNAILFNKENSFFFLSYYELHLNSLEVQTSNLPIGI